MTPFLLVTHVDTANLSVHPIFETGDVHQRINLVILAEGYRDEEQEAFLQDAQEMVGYLFRQEPFHQYEGFFNVYAVPVVSAESGADDPSRGIGRNTYFNSTYDSWGLPHGLTIPPNNFEPDPEKGFGKARSLLDTVFPSYDLIIILVNDSHYGGWGDYRGVVVPTHYSAGEILTHEMGHAFGELGDEYTDPFPLDPEPVKEEPNTTQETVREQIKWRAWIDSTTPVPTSTEGYADRIGLFEGARYHETGWYRPKARCRMGVSGIPFCEVCREALVLAVYRRKDGIAAQSPENSQIQLRGSEQADLAIELMPGSSFIRWLVDGAPEDSPLDLSRIFRSVDLGPGTHQITAEAADPTDWVRNDPENLLHSTRSWDLDVSGVTEAQSNRLLFPLYRTGSDQFTGIALSNYGDADQAVELTGFNSEGSAVEHYHPGEGLALRSLEQDARLTSEYFVQDDIAWIEARAESPTVGGLFLVGDGKTELDGAAPLAFPLKDQCLQPLFDGDTAFRGKAARTRLYLANPNSHTVDIELRVFTDQSGEPASAVSRSLPPMGQLSGDLTDLFPELNSISRGFLEVKSLRGAGVVGYALVEVGEGSSLFGLVGRQQAASTEAFAAQFAQGPSLFSELDLVNRADVLRAVIVTVVADDGQSIAERTVRIEPNRLLSLSEGLLPSSGEVKTGSLRVRSDGPGIVGTVILGDSERLKYATAVPLEDGLLREAIFSQVANTAEIFTGLALFNPGLEASSIQIDVYDAVGLFVGSEDLILGSGERQARLIQELVASSKGLVRGHIRVRSSQSVAATQIFGASTGEYYCAVPARIIN